jgi:hypothetical protein
MALSGQKTQKLAEFTKRHHQMANVRENWALQFWADCKRGVKVDR